MASAELRYERVTNPIDLVEKVATQHDWGCERTADQELTLVVAGSWSDYHISINWRDDLETMHIACAFDLKVPDRRMNEVYRLIATVNEQLWLGHFDYWDREGIVLYRHGAALHDAVLTPAQAEAMLSAALEACERYYQAFQFCVWAGKPAQEALASTMFDTQGQA